MEYEELQAYPQSLVKELPGGVCFRDANGHYFMKNDWFEQDSAADPAAAGRDASYATYLGVGNAACTVKPNETVTPVLLRITSRRLP